MNRPTEADRVTSEPVPTGVTPPVAALGAADVLSALQLVREGRVFDLDSGRWPGMPLFSGHPPFQVTTYRTPWGIRASGDHEPFEPNDARQLWLSEVVSGTMHSGTHIDALCHITRGPDDEFFGGRPAREHVSDFGVMAGDAWDIPPIVTRGVLIDVPAARGLHALPAGEEITREDVTRALDAQRTELRAGDIALVRTGLMSAWPDPERMAEHLGAGIGLEAALLLAESGVVAVGTDTESIECSPTRVPGNPSPAHCALLVNRGILVLEWVYMEELSEAAAFEFLFMCAPLKVRGATGSMLRPLAIV